MRDRLERLALFWLIALLVILALGFIIPEIPPCRAAQCIVVDWA